MDQDQFGYRLDWLPDGRAELHDPTVADALRGVGANLSIFVGIYLLLMFALLCVPMVFLVLGSSLLLSSLGLPPHWAHEGGPLGAIAAIVVGAFGTTFLWRRILLHRTWRIEKNMISRCWKVIGFNIRREKEYEGVYALEIFHEEWSDDKGATDTLLGKGHGRSYTFESVDQSLPGLTSGLSAGPCDPPSFPRKPSESASVPLEDRITPEVRWLGRRLATLSGFPLTMHQGFRTPPSQD